MRLSSLFVSRIPVSTYSRRIWVVPTVNCTLTPAIIIFYVCSTIISYSLTTPHRLGSDQLPWCVSAQPPLFVLSCSLARHIDDFGGATTSEAATLTFQALGDLLSTLELYFSPNKDFARAPSKSMGLSGHLIRHCQHVTPDRLHELLSRCQALLDISVISRRDSQYSLCWALCLLSLPVFFRRASLCPAIWTLFALTRLHMSSRTTNRIYDGGVISFHATLVSP